MNTSGSMPLAWIEVPEGVKYKAVVSFMAVPSGRSTMFCTLPFPKVRVPTKTARW